MSNESVIKSKMDEFIKRLVHADIMKLLDRVAQQVISLIENGGEIPFATGNLQDSTGIGIYHEGILKRYLPNKTAIKSRSDIYPAGLTDRDNIWGRNQLNEAIGKGALLYTKGYWLVIYSAMPYASLVNLRTDFWNEHFQRAPEKLIDDIISQFELKF